MQRTIPLLDLPQEHQAYRQQLDRAIRQVVDSAQFVRGAEVGAFEYDLAEYLRAAQVIGCGNGTDALQIALMALELRAGDEVLIPAFTYAATVEVALLLGLTPVLVDVDPDTFTVRARDLAPHITPATRAIIPVHLFGQCADMNPILALAQQHNLSVVEDAAQAMGAVYLNETGLRRAAGTLGDFGCTSFFPSKNLACFGDGGAVIVGDGEKKASRARAIANHGQQRRYLHECIGINSRLDTLQAAVLRIKLQYLDSANAKRAQHAALYDEYFQDLDSVSTPLRAPYSTHVYHQYTIRVPADRRNALRDYLGSRGIQTGVYYPRSLHQQPGYRSLVRWSALPNTKELCSSVLSLPVGPTLQPADIAYVAASVRTFTTA